MLLRKFPFLLYEITWLSWDSSENMWCLGRAEWVWEESRTWAGILITFHCLCLDDLSLRVYQSAGPCSQPGRLPAATWGLVGHAGPGGRPRDGPVKGSWVFPLLCLFYSNNSCGCKQGRWGSKGALFVRRELNLRMTIYTPLWFQTFLW